MSSRLSANRVTVRPWVAPDQPGTGVAEGKSDVDASCGAVAPMLAAVASDTLAHHTARSADGTDR